MASFAPRTFTREVPDQRGDRPIYEIGVGNIDSKAGRKKIQARLGMVRRDGGRAVVRANDDRWGSEGGAVATYFPDDNNPKFYDIRGRGWSVSRREGETNADLHEVILPSRGDPSVVGKFGRGF